MSDLPELTICICTCRRPWYAMITLGAITHFVHYDGPVKYHIADGGSSEEELRYYKIRVEGAPYTISVTPDLASMINSCAAVAGEVWWITLDDFVPMRHFDLSADVRFMQANPDVGAIRMGRLAHWENGPDEELWAQLRHLGGQHWWVFDKERTTHPFVASLNTTLYHRRYWEAYGDLDPVRPDWPGDAESELAFRYNHRPGPTIAVPMRFGQNGDGELTEPIWQLPSWRTDAYAAAGVGGRM